MRLAWLKVEGHGSEPSLAAGAPHGKSAANDAGTIQQFMSMPNVSGGWIGPPPFRAEDVMRLAAEAKKAGQPS